MDGRRKFSYEGRTVAPGMMRHGPVSSSSSSHRLSDPPSRLELLEDKITVQASEIERLVGENRRLATTQIALREDLACTQDDIPKLEAHIRSIQTESDIQMRVLLGKIGKMEKDIRRGESVKKELQKAHLEAQSLVKDRQELAEKIRTASEELQKERLDIKRLPDLCSELDSLRQEHQRLCGTFKHEKAVNTEKVEQMREVEKNLIGMAREYERLRGEVLNAEMRARAPPPYNGGYVNPGISYQLAIQGGGIYVDSYGRSLAQTGFMPTGDGMITYGGENVVGPTTGGVGTTTVSSAAVGVVWGGPFDPSLAPSSSALQWWLCESKHLIRTNLRFKAVASILIATVGLSHKLVLCLQEME